MGFIDPEDFIETSSWLSYLYTKYYRNETKQIRMLSIKPAHESESKKLVDEMK